MGRIEQQMHTTTKTLPNGTEISRRWRLGEEIEGGYSSLLSRETTERIAGREVFTSLDFSGNNVSVYKNTSYLGQEVVQTGEYATSGIKSYNTMISEALHKGRTVIGDMGCNKYIQYANDGSYWHKQIGDHFITRNGSKLAMLKIDGLWFDPRYLEESFDKLPKRERDQIIKYFAEQTKAAEAKAAGAAAEVASATSGSVASTAAKSADATQELVSKGVSSASKWKTAAKWAGIAFVGGLAAYGLYKFIEHANNKIQDKILPKDEQEHLA